MSTSRSGSAAVRTRNRGTLLIDKQPKFRRWKAIGVGDKCLYDAVVEGVNNRVRVADGSRKASVKAVDTNVV